MKKNKPIKVRQSNHLIESPYSQEFSIHEIKLFEIALAECKQEDIKLFESETNKKFSFSSAELAKLLNTSVSTISHEIEKTAARIMKKTIHLRKVLPDGSVEFEMINIMPYAKYKNGILDFQINYQIIPYLVELNSNFTEFHLDNLLIMNSSYGIKLYKLLYQYKNIKYRVFHIDDLKKQFGLIDKYQQYKDFKRRILEPSIFQINSNTDLNVYCKEVKSGRKVEKLEFTFELKKLQLPTVKAETTDTSDDNRGCLNVISHIESELSNQTKVLISKFTQEKGVDYVEASIVYAKKNAKSNLDKYLSDTLTKGWAELEIRKLKTKKTTDEAQLQKIKQESSEKIKLKELDNANRAEIENLWHKLSDAQKALFISYSEYILEKYSSKLSRFELVSEKLPMSIFAVSNQRYYDKVLESYIKNMIKVSLNINDFTCRA